MKKIIILLIVLVIGSALYFRHASAQAMCLVTEVSWVSQSINAGDTAKFVITINDRGLCNGKNIGVNIFEDDTVFDDRITLVTQLFSAPSGNQMEIDYLFTVADYDSANDAGEGSSEEVYLIATTPGQTVSVTSSNITFSRGASTQRYACVSGGVYACSPGNLSNCSDVGGVCSASCRQIDTSQCGQSVGPAPGGGPPGPGGGGSGGGAYDPNQGLSGSPGSDLSIQRVYGIIVGLTCWFSRIALLIMVGAIIIYGIMMMWAGENATAFSDARKSLMWAMVGVIVVLGTYTIIATVADFVDPGNLTGINRALPISCS